MPESVEVPDWRSAASLRMLNMCRAVFSAISPPNTFSSAPREEDQHIIFMKQLSVGDPDLEPDLHVFGPPGSGSDSGSFPFLRKVLSRLK